MYEAVLLQKLTPYVSNMPNEGNFAIALKIRYDPNFKLRSARLLENYECSYARDALATLVSQSRYQEAALVYVRLLGWRNPWND